MIDEGLRDLLLAQPGITGLAASQTLDNRAWASVFLETPAQGFKPPYIVISIIDEDPLATLGPTTGLIETEFDIDCIGGTKAKANRLAEAVKDFLKDYTGPAGTIDTIKAVLLTNTQDDKFQDGTGNDSWRHQRTRTYKIWHQANV